MLKVINGTREPKKNKDQRLVMAQMAFCLPYQNQANPEEADTHSVIHTSSHVQPRHQMPQIMTPSCQPEMPINI